ncbi:M23 family metallopeptidase [Streptomyces antimycoticus]|uniref:M23 family metallopeptidase n=3 Tax=Streptomyces TaxID=1883 RepID=A0ABD5JM01_9ACTN|nr:MULTISPECIES: M23 family metallopeptidase [Streptomyces]MEE4588752.1 M23 family metallopeptidase [Streptomyces sp. DSM 41602]AJZ82166.1 M23 family metallopeptidase [Streptomyces sp. AgN23]KUL51276.1 peptidase [Streptomyces violaceusniger]RSS36336.1 M23 family metallopeptidase [Streptomyces sp. WAC05858]WJD98083.1 M23 family metallopeptidase [Streptomyces antimycoticus]
MAPRATNRRFSLTSVSKGRAAVVAVGLGASLALGAGTAFAVGAGEAPAAPSVKVAAKAPAKKAPAKKAPKDWQTPVDKFSIGAAFGLAGNLWSHNHSGQDFVVPTGTPVHAAHEGVVVKAGPNGGGDGPAYGNAIVIKHDNATYSQYAHLSRIDVRIGQTVTEGQQIGLSGSTGNSTGPHLHFEIRTTPNYGTAVEPLKFLRDHGVKV